MIIPLPEKVNTIISALNKAGFEAYAVGGCVRDSILKREPKDWDITTSAKPEDIKQIFSRTVDTGILHGTVTVLLEKEGFEVTTYRIDGEYKDSRHPEHVTFTSNLIEDLKRRDFTINAMAYNDTEGLIDVFGGMQDLKQKVIRCVGEPKERFLEDALRMMRAIRFAAQLGFVIDSKTKDAIVTLASTMHKISAERIQVELVKLLISDHPKEMRTLYETKITSVILPEFDAMMHTPQQNKYHKYSVGEHTLKALEYVPNDKVLRLTMLFHDIAKPVTRIRDQKNIDHFYGHAKKSAEMTKDILKRLKFDTDTLNRVTRLITWHDDNPKLEATIIRKRMHRIGLMQFPNLFLVKKADTLAKSTYQQQELLEYIEKYQQIYEQILKAKECITLKELAISGKDLIALGIKPGIEIGDILDTLLEKVLEDPNKNTKEILLFEANLLRKDLH